MKAKEIKKELNGEKIGLFIIDYLQLLSPETIRKGMSTNDIMSDISKGVKNLGRMYKCPVIALSQLNRELEKRQDKIAKKNKFKITSHSMQLYGTCEVCQEI